MFCSSDRVVFCSSDRVHGLKYLCQENDQFQYITHWVKLELTEIAINIARNVQNCVLIIDGLKLCSGDW